MTDPERLDLPSASSFAYDVACPGRRQFIRSLPKAEEAPDPDAERGTRIHLALATGNTADLNQEELDTYQQCRKFEENIYEQWRTARAITKPPTCFQEERLWLHDPETLDPILSGQLDLYWAQSPNALIIDRKTGWATHVPPSQKSWQLLIQAVLISYNYPTVENIWVAYCKPKVKAEPTDLTEYTRKDLEHARQLTLFYLDLIQHRPNAPRHAGPQCTWCPGKAYCPEAGAYALLPSVRNGDPLAMVQQLSGPDLALIWERSAVIEKILEKVKERLKGFSEEELFALGIERGKARRLDTITNIPDAFNKAIDHISEGDIWTCLKMSLPKLSGLFRAKKGFTSEQADKFARDLLGDAVTTNYTDAPLRKAQR